jgi:hypothetical protein
MSARRCVRNIEEAERQRPADPFVQIVAGESDAQFFKIELDLARGRERRRESRRRHAPWPTPQSPALA